MCTSKELLIEVSTHLSDAGANFVVVGGWSPYLLNKTQYPHPGTKDVDVLFSDGDAENGLTKYIEVLLDKGFMPSAKHDFQLLKAVKVGNSQLVFNVDLLHPSETLRNPEMFVDHFDLNIKTGDIDGKFIRSIVLPSSSILFEAGFSDDIEVESPVSANKSTIKLISGAGCILSKCESVSSKKRERDSFDIYLSLVSCGAENIKNIIEPYKDKEGVKKMLDSLKKFVLEKEEDGAISKFDTRVFKYMKNYPTTSPSKEVLALLDMIYL